MEYLPFMMPYMRNPLRPKKSAFEIRHDPAREKTSHDLLMLEKAKTKRRRRAAK